MKEIFDRIIANLNNVTVKGKENHALLYNSIDALEHLRDMIHVETREIHPEEAKTVDANNKQGENG